MRLRSHYFLLAFSIVVPVALCCGIALNMLQNAQHGSAINRIEASASLTAQVIDADIHRAKAVINALANSHALATGDLARFHAEARAASAGPGAWIILYDSTGQQVVNTRLAHGEALPMRPDPEFVTAMLASGKSQVSGVKWGAALNNHYVIVESPIRTSEGKGYIIGQAFSPEYFAHSFGGNAIPHSWRVAIIDRSGIFIARSQGAAAFVGKSADATTLEVLRNSHGGVFVHPKHDGVEVYDAYTHSDASGWAVIMGAPVSEIDAIVWRGVSVMSAGLFIALILALTLTMLAGRQLVRFVGRASQAAAKLGQGREVRDLPRSAIVELEQMNVAIREANARLQAEMSQRARAEHERNSLLVSEKTARARAEEQNAAKDEFLAMLGHELRNPLSAVASAIAILDSGRVDDAMAARAREVVRRQTAQLRKLVDDLLEVNRALMGKLELDKAPVDLAEVASRCLETLKASGRCAGFNMRIDTVSVLVDADAARLMQIIDNLLDNAVKYSPGGGVIAIGVCTEGADAVLTVQDSGQGIAPELLPKVFDIFVQGTQTLQRAHGGLGIGLSLVRRLVELHGGSVALDSAGPGLGSTATVRLPRAAEAAPRGAAPAAAAPARRRRVLLVEDNDDARDMMTMLLELRDCEVVAAASGPEALPLAQQAQPDLAFIDIGLPGMDGYALARSLKGDARTAHIELIALTGYGGEKDRSQALAAGFDRHFTKPIRMEDLQEALQ